MQIDIKRQKLTHLTSVRRRAYDQVKKVAIDVLELGTPYAFEIIYEAFQEYEKAEQAQAAYISRHAKEYAHPLQFLVMQKNIADVYWSLPTPIKELWDANPELLAYRKKYF
jgi:hypothetical protein